MVAGNELRVLISAAEASSDLHGSELLRALQAEAARRKKTVRAVGIGGPRLRAAGLEPVFDARELLSMGFLEVIVRLPRILQGLRRIAAAALKFRPHVAVVIDYPDFHLKLSKRLFRIGIPLVYYIPPKVWVWRHRRVAALRARFGKVLGIFPYEEGFFARHGVPFVYVGNPLLDELPLNLSRDEARARVGISPGEKVLLLMPGSRPAELKLHLELMLDAALRSSATVSPLSVLLPLPETADVASISARIEDWRIRRGQTARTLKIRLSQGDSATAMVAADAGLIKSGTSTLEAAVLGCPHAVVYRTGWLSAFLYRWLVRYRGPVGLVNLVAAWDPKSPDSYRDANAPRVAREILLDEMTVENLAGEAIRLLTDPGTRDRILQACREIRRKLAGDGRELSPSRRAAQEIFGMLADQEGSR